jgi:hypothetical protein
MAGYRDHDKTERTLQVWKVWPTTFSLAEVCRLSGIGASMIRTWMRRKQLTPVAEGCLGSHFSNRFSPQQLLGLGAAAELLRSKRSCSQDYAISVVRWFEQMDDAALAQFIELRVDDHTEESSAGWMQLGHLDKTKVLRTGDDEIVEAVVARWRVCEDAIRAKLKSARRNAERFNKD